MFTKHCEALLFLETQIRLLLFFSSENKKWRPKDNQFLPNANFIPSSCISPPLFSQVELGQCFSACVCVVLCGSHALFMGLASTFFSKNNFKTRFHGTIHTFKNYFTTMFSVFGYKQYLNGPQSVYTPPCISAALFSRSPRALYSIFLLLLCLWSSFFISLAR